mmetsp:Transcript_37982/g.94379  ORF Transcript_37982/g.94379 Transcript_37982/m.94379 type:complete len:93 (-) Transcript_37982:32-310(-)
MMPLNKVMAFAHKCCDRWKSSNDCRSFDEESLRLGNLLLRSCVFMRAHAQVYAYSCPTIESIADWRYYLESLACSPAQGCCATTGRRALELP